MKKTTDHLIVSVQHTEATELQEYQDHFSSPRGKECQEVCRGRKREEGGCEDGNDEKDHRGYLASNTNGSAKE